MTEVHNQYLYVFKDSESITSNTFGANISAEDLVYTKNNPGVCRMQTCVVCCVYVRFDTYTTSQHLHGGIANAIVKDTY